VKNARFGILDEVFALFVGRRRAVDAAIVVVLATRSPPHVAIDLIVVLLAVAVVDHAASLGGLRRGHGRQSLESRRAEAGAGDGAPWWELFAFGVQNIAMSGARQASSQHTLVIK